MARAKRHYVPDQVWHITQRCHKREFLLKFKQDLREATLTLDRKAIIAVIEGIEPVSLDTAKGLRTLADNFQLGLICDLLGDNYEE